MPMTITLDQEVEKRIDVLAEQAGQDREAIVKMAIENGMDDIADYFSASAVLKRINNGEEKVFSPAEVRAELGLDD